MWPSAGRVRAIRRAVLDGAGRLWRDLPWRATRDPWQVLVSEVMLQQTQAARVVGPYVAFVERFPTPAACAAAGAAEVVRAWAGLGYNRRALYLHRAASAVCEHHGGELPGDLGALVALPGVGAYTARAVLAFAFGADVGVVDTNVARLLARCVAGRPLRPSQAQALADRLVPPGDGWRFNQALFDLGAQACTARRPTCVGCPLRRRCRWATGGWPEPDPAWRGGTAGWRVEGFAGSDRQGRGRLVAALRAAPVDDRSVAAACGWPDDPERAARVAAALVAEGLARREGGSLSLA